MKYFIYLYIYKYIYIYIYIYVCKERERERVAEREREIQIYLLFISSSFIPDDSGKLKNENDHAFIYNCKRSQIHPRRE